MSNKVEVARAIYVQAVLIRGKTGRRENLGYVSYQHSNRFMNMFGKVLLLIAKYRRWRHKYGEFSPEAHNQE